MYGESLEGDETVLADVGMRLCLSDRALRGGFIGSAERVKGERGVEGVYRRVHVQLLFFDSFACEGVRSYSLDFSFLRLSRAILSSRTAFSCLAREIGS